MATFKTESKDSSLIEKDGKKVRVIKKTKFDSFNPEILGLGNIQEKSRQINALSVLFDLEGFTNFCKQIDPQLAVPEYLSEFLDWIFQEVRNENIHAEYDEGIDTYSDFPFYSKFMGDGILFLWDIDKMSEKKTINVIVSMLNICRNYVGVFLPKISKKVASPPRKLRCGIARGAIYTVGNGSDFVGPCINVSARLQKLHNLSFCFSRRGLNLDTNPSLKDEFITKRVDIRGIGGEELVCVLKKEFDKLSKEDKEKFADS
jgi:hypothetical protein